MWDAFIWWMLHIFIQRRPNTFEAVFWNYYRKGISRDFNVKKHQTALRYFFALALRAFRGIAFCFTGVFAPSDKWAIHCCPLRSGFPSWRAFSSSSTVARRFRVCEAPSSPWFCCTLDKQAGGDFSWSGRLNYPIFISPSSSDVCREVYRIKLKEECQSVAQL